MLISVYFWNWNQKWFYFFLSFGNESKESLVEIIRRPSVKQLERTTQFGFIQNSVELAWFE